MITIIICILVAVAVFFLLRWSWSHFKSWIGKTMAEFWTGRDGSE